MLLGFRLHLQFMRLLLELLDDPVVEVQGQSLERGRRIRRGIAFLIDVFSQQAHAEQSHKKGKYRAEEHDRGSQHHGVSQ